MFPHTKEEKRLTKQGYQFIAGIDEAGRGALAGPVVAAAVVMPAGCLHPKAVKDSKLLSPKMRDKLFDEILENCLGYGVGIIGSDVIDEINIYQASKLAMKQAVMNIEKVKPDHLLVDAMKVEVEIPQKSIVKGDLNIYSIACASIIAKVTRDRIMLDLHDKYPEYGFDAHKGYGTKIHLDCLEKHGQCAIHRKTYAPVANIIKL